MKFGKTYLVISLLTLLAGCNIFDNSSSSPTSESSDPVSSSSSIPTSIPSSSSEITTSSSSTSTPTSEPTSKPTSTSIPTSESTSITTTTPSTSNPSSSTSGTDIESIPVNFTAINDYHGQLDENGYQVGIAKTTTYLKDKKAKGDILINSGDSYQGSLICYEDKGHFLSSIFKDIGFDSYTIGNHEFDWGVSSILSNEEVLGQKMLGANIYKYPKVDGEWEKADLGKLYDIVTLYEGTPQETKVGIIGVIGSRQITSITSLYTEDYIFLNPDPIVKELAIELRENKECDIVVASYHDASPDDSIAYEVPGKNYRYVDACFMGHTHSFDSYTVNDVPFVQAGAYSQGASEVSLLFNKATSSVTLEDYGYQNLFYLDLQADEEVAEALQDIKDAHHSEFNDIVGRNETGREIDVYSMSSFYAKVSYEKATNEGHELAACIFNQSRRPLKAGDFTYSDLYETHPFMNEIYILSCDDYDIYNECRYGCAYVNPEYTLNPGGSSFHDVLVFDYNGLHIGVNDSYEKFYNYFPSAFSSEALHEPIKLDFTCVEATLEWLQVHNAITSADINY